MEIYVVLTYTSYGIVQVHEAFFNLKKAEAFYEKLYKKMSKEEKEWNNKSPRVCGSIRTVTLNK